MEHTPQRRVPLLVGHRVRFERMSVTDCVQQAAVCAQRSLLMVWQVDYPAIGRVPEDESAGAEAGLLLQQRCWLSVLLLLLLASCCKWFQLRSGGSSSGWLFSKSELCQSVQQPLQLLSHADHRLIRAAPCCTKVNCLCKNYLCQG